ncbi:histidine phosphatase family protein [Gammaproteobacteria bacterium]|nr:histidine phosphatase family protein [Gammaproteobacteria bacterium]
MKLFFLRHAKSDWGNPALKDFDRPLNKRGLRDAPLMGKKLHHYFPDNLKVISSPAKRTKETLELFFTDYDQNFSIEFDDALYHGASSDYLKNIISLSKEDAVIFIGHNPGISQAASMFSNNDIVFPTCGCIGFSIEKPSIDSNNFHDAIEIFYEYPKKA